MKPLLSLLVKRTASEKLEMKLKYMIRNFFIILCLGGLMVSMGCVNRTPKNYLRSSYSDKAKPTTLDSRKYSRIEIPPPKINNGKEEKPKKKSGLWPFGKKEAVESSGKAESRPEPAPAQEKKKQPKKKFSLWPFGKKDTPKKTDTGLKPAIKPAITSSPEATRPLQSPREPYRYRLKYGDSIVINLRGVPNAEPIQERVDENGNIKLDYIGSVYALGKTAAELEDSIERTYLDQKIYRNLSVSVQLPQKSYFIRGEVLKPGRFSLLGGVSIVQAIATAGGFNDFANPKDVLIIRSGKNIKINVKDIERNPSQDIQIEEGDVIVVKRSFL